MCDAAANNPSGDCDLVVSKSFVFDCLRLTTQWYVGERAQSR